MTTQRNINEAKLAASTAKDALSHCMIDRDAFKKYIDEINGGVWDSETVVLPQSGPLTVRQAALINIQMEEDFGYPTLFARRDIWGLAGQQYEALEIECKTLSETYNQAASTVEGLEATHLEDLDRAAEIASKDPSIIAAQRNVEAVKIKAAADLEKQSEENRNRKENVRMLVGGFIGLIAVILLLKIFKIF